MLRSTTARVFTIVNLINPVVVHQQRAYAKDNRTKLTTLIEAVQSQNTTAIMALAKQQPALIAEQTSNDNTALHEAAKRGDVAMIQLLSKEFSEHFNVNHKCHCYLQRTPLHYASEGGHNDAAETLLNMGADPNITDEKGRTALDYALEKKNETLALMLHKQGGRANVLKAEAEQFTARSLSKRFADSYVAKQTPEIAAVDGFDDFLKQLNASRKPK